MIKRDQTSHTIIIATFFFDFNSNILYCQCLFFSDSTIGGFTYCSDNGLNFSASAAAYSEDDGDFTPGRRGKTSRVSVTVYFIPKKYQTIL